MQCIRARVESRAAELARSKRRDVTLAVFRGLVHFLWGGIEKALSRGFAVSREASVIIICSPGITMFL